MQTATATYDEGHAMTDDTRPSALAAVQSLATAPPGSGLSKYAMLIRVLVISVPVIGAVPTAMNLYQAWKLGISPSEVSHRLAQYDLAIKNFDCRIDYKALNAGDGVRIDAGACPSSGDIQIKITPPSGKATIEWIAFNSLNRTSSARMSGVSGWLVSSAAAQEAPSAAGAGSGLTPVRVAQAGQQVLCKSLVSRTQSVQVISEGGKCFRETVSLVHGKVEKREEVPCNTSCPAPMKG